MSEARVLSIQLPNPYFERDNNAYLIDAGELALIDTGIDTPEAFSTLERALTQHGYRVEEIKKIFLTHKHLDHFGLAHRLQEVCGARVYIHQDDQQDVAHFDERYDLIHRLYLEKMCLWGLPRRLIDVIARRFARLGRSVSAEALRDGQKIPLGHSELLVIHTPGHTQGSACFLLEDVLFTGDHLLPDYTPNIGATDLSASGMLFKYRASLKRLRRFSGARVLPGHGDEIMDSTGRIEAILTHHQERAERIRAILSDRKPRTVYEIALLLFGKMREHHALLGAGEVQAHLEALEERGLVARLPDHRYWSPPRTSKNAT